MKIDKSRLNLNPSVAAISGLGIVATTVSTIQSANAVGTVPPDVQTGLDTAQATVVALNPIALAALTVALVPMGAMLTLRFLNMVLSRV